LLANPCDDFLHPFSVTNAGHNERPLPSHASAVPIHHGEIGPDIRRKVNLVDHKKITCSNSRASLTGNLVSFGDVDDEDERVRQLSGEDRRQVITSGFHDYEFEPWEHPLKVRDRAEVRAGIVSNCCVRAAASLNSDDPFERENFAPREELGIFVRVNVVRDDCEVNFGPELAAESLNECRFAGTNRTGDPQSECLSTGARVTGWAGHTRVIVAVLGADVMPRRSQS
jgi:hypothetical protein